MDYIQRPIYLNHIISLLDKGMMLFLIGQRRVGKSFMLRQAKDWIETNIPSSNVIYINKEDSDFDAIHTYTELNAFVYEHIKPGAKNYLLIDEVQDIGAYENALRNFYAKDECQIIATGSNACVFSSELSTRLSGRYIEIPVYSLTYKEFLEFQTLEDNDESLMAYLRVGGLPGLKRFNISDEAEVRDYLQGVYNTIVLKDVVLRHEIRNVEFCENLSRFVADNIGKIISPGSIYKYMKSAGTKISQAVVSDYLDHLHQALLVNKVARYDIRGKSLFETNFKYYFSDHGIRNLLDGFKISRSIEKIMENAVWHHLVAQGFTVTVGILRAGEIDFVAEKGAQRLYIQVCYLLASEETRQREFGNLMRIKDNYPKYVVSMDPIADGFNANEGIHHFQLRKFLTMEL